jgi:site-specific recombinase XerD
VIIVLITVAFSVEIQSLGSAGVHSTAQSAVPQRRGRPQGAQTPVRADGQLGHHHFAFLRAVAQGLDPAVSAERYLVGQERVDPRTARVMERALVQRVVDVARALDDLALREASEQLALGEPTSLNTARTVPSLNEFADTLESDMYSESELIALYSEEYGSDISHPSALKQRGRLRALDYLQTRLAKTPRGADSLAQWLPPTLCTSLRVHGVLSLDNLVTFINASGRTWYRLVPRLGRTRSARLISWLVEVQQHLTQPLQQTPKLTPTCAVGHTPIELQNSKFSYLVSTALVPLEQLYVAPALDGHAGVFRASHVNTLGANNDLQAIKAWLTLLGGKSPHTQVAYKREIERFYLWAVLERCKPLSSLDAVDCAAYTAFLQSPPAHWVHALPYPRSHPLWRPLRGPLSAASIQRSLAATLRLFADLVDAQYLRANPMPRTHAKSNRQVELDVMRSFSIEDQQCIATALHNLPNNASARRLRALLMLLLGCGLRVSETRLTWAAVINPREQGHEGQDYALRVLGKGNKERIVPVRPEVVQALRHHQQDLVLLTDKQIQDLPLIGTLRPSPSVSLGISSRPGDPLSTTGVYSVLKSFFAKVVKYHVSGTSRADFSQASAHWMRHTFAHQVLAATDNDLAVVQQLLGHSSIQTTAIYVKADLQERKQAVNAMQSPLFS